MRTIQSRIQHCKDRVPLSAPKTAESLQLQKDVDEFIKNGGKIKVANISDANFINDIEKGKRSRKKMAKKRLNLDDYKGLPSSHELFSKDLVKILGVKNSGTVHNYFTSGVIPKPSKKAVKSIIGHRWLLGDLIKHNKELSK